MNSSCIVFFLIKYCWHIHGVFVCSFNIVCLNWARLHLFTEMVTSAEKTAGGDQLNMRKWGIKQSSGNRVTRRTGFVENKRERTREPSRLFQKAGKNGRERKRERKEVEEINPVNTTGFRVYSALEYEIAMADGNLNARCIF